jgi:hypothetical protein
MKTSIVQIAFFSTFLLVGTLTISACGNKTAAAVVGATCATVPSGATVNGSNYSAATGHCTVETSGKWTALTVHVPTSGGAVTLNATCDDVAPVYTNQATFDAGEGGPGVTSNADFFTGSTCTSASNHSTTTTELFIWRKNP